MTICVRFDAESPGSCSNVRVISFSTYFVFEAFAFRRSAQYFRMRTETAFRAAADIPRRRRRLPAKAGTAA